MSGTAREFFVLSRGKWDADATPEQIQRAIDAFYQWRDRLVEAGRMKPGQRLSTEGKVVSRQGVMDGPFAETREVIGGYWILIADSLDAAAALAAQNPCIACGLSFEVRPVEHERASAYRVTNETPGRSGALT